MTKDSGITIDRDGKVTLSNERAKITREVAQPLAQNMDLINEVNSVLTSIESDLVILGHQKAQFENFKGFLSNAKAMKAEYLSAADDLLKMLADKKYNALKTALGKTEKGDNFANPALAYQLMDRIKAIFATIPETQKSTRQNVVNLAKQRNVEFKKNHKGKSVLEEFSQDKLHFDYENLASNLSENPQSVTIDNLVGFTAFYKRKAGEARGMSMTAYGQTNVLDKTFPIEEEKKSDAKEWVINNLKKHSTQMQAISRSLGKVANGPTKGVNDE